jgi:hypothetical protein
MLNKLAFTLAVLSSAASAETLTCPVGGERFAAPEIAVCGEYIGQTMLLMSAGCPPDRLPQCPQNFLPMYKAFSTEELALLGHFMQSETYDSNVDFSPYYLAYIIEKYLNGPDNQLPALLLLWGLWQDPALIAEDPDFMVALSREIEANFYATAPDDNALMLAMLAFTQLLAGHTEAGLGYLARAESQDARSPEAQSYLSAVRTCFTDPSAAHCTANAAIPRP